MNKKEINFLLEKVKNRPNTWREGQALFNYAEDYTGLFLNLRGPKIDCFHNDEKIPEMLKYLKQDEIIMKTELIIKRLKTHTKEIYDEITELEKLL